MKGTIHLYLTQIWYHDCLLISNEKGLFKIVFSLGSYFLNTYFI